MANIKSAKKRWRQNLERQARNRTVKSRMRSFVRKTREALDANDVGQVQEMLPQTLSEIDRAVRKGVIHKNSGARKKSSLQRRAANLQQP